MVQCCPLANGAIASRDFTPGYFVLQDYFLVNEAMRSARCAPALCL
ncbi:MAG: hypothetical protein N5P05_000432 [Chroococcopsis gigantea SAG 12.99]|nr:hypothetical protein [Chroococcopsis gigantea SAG 12.99]